MIRPTLAACLCILLGACASRPVSAPTLPLPPPPPSGEPAGLVGLSVVQLRQAFGAPAFARKESGAEMWRYDGANCRAFFFLYPDGNDQIVRHVETLPRGKDIAADVSCLGVLRGHRP